VADLLAVLGLRDALVTRGGALVDVVQQARAEVTPPGGAPLDVQRAGAEPEYPLHRLDGRPQVRRAGERAEQRRAFGPGLAREVDAGEIVADRDLQVREGLVVLQLDVEPRLHVLDEPRFGQDRVHLALGLEEVDVGYQRHQVPRPDVRRGGFAEVVRHPLSQAFGLPHVQHAALLVLHQVDAGHVGELAHLLPQFGMIGFLLGHARHYSSANPLRLAGDFSRRPMVARTATEVAGSTTPPRGRGLLGEAP